MGVRRCRAWLHRIAPELFDVENEATWSFARRLVCFVVNATDSTWLPHRDVCVSFESMERQYHELGRRLSTFTQEDLGETWQKICFFGFDPKCKNMVICLISKSKWIVVPMSVSEVEASTDWVFEDSFSTGARLSAPSVGWNFILRVRYVSKYGEEDVGDWLPLERD